MRELGGYREHQQRQQEAQLFAAQPCAEAGPDLRADDAADQQQQGKDGIHGAVGVCLQKRHIRRDEDDLQQRGPRHHRGRHAERVNHRGDQHKPAADSENRAQHTDSKAETGRQ